MIKMDDARSNFTWAYLFAACLVAIVSSFAALFIGEVMGQTPCYLCWYQRAFMFPLAVTLAVASFMSDYHVWRYGLPLAAIGGLIAAYHSILYFELIPRPIVPCGTGPSCTSSNMTVLGVVPIPILSLAAFTIVLVLLIGVWRRSTA